MTIEEADQLLGQVFSVQGYVVIGCWEEQAMGAVLSRVDTGRFVDLHTVPLKVVGSSNLQEAEQQALLVSQITGKKPNPWDPRIAAFYRVEAAD